MNKKFIAGCAGIMFVVIVLLVLFGMSRQASFPTSSRKIQVVTSFYPLYFFAMEIAGDKADIVNITPPGAEPHDYEPTAIEVGRIEKSNLLVLNGGGLEPWGEAVIKNIDTKHTLIVTAGQGLTTGQIEEDGRIVTDPHVWLDPALAKQMVDKIAQGLVRADLNNRGYYEARARALEDRLNDLDALYKRGLARCKQKNIVTSHAAFHYLAQTYGLTQVPIAGLSPDAEPSAQELGKITSFARVNRIKYIFFESLVSPKLAETIAREIGAKTLVLNPIEGLLPEESARGENYFTIMQNNLQDLHMALQCTQ